MPQIYQDCRPVNIPLYPACKAGRAAYEVVNNGAQFEKQDGYEGEEEKTSPGGSVTITRYNYDDGSYVYEMDHEGDFYVGVYEWFQWSTYLNRHRRGEYSYI